MALAEAAVDIEADFTKFDAGLKKALDRAIVQASRRGRAAGNAWARAFVKAASRITRDLSRELTITAKARDLGEDAGAAFRDGFKKWADRGLVELPDLAPIGKEKAQEFERGFERQIQQSNIGTSLNRALTRVVRSLGALTLLTAKGGGLVLLAGAAATATLALIKLSSTLGAGVIPLISALATAAGGAAGGLAALGSAAIVAAVVVVNTLKLALEGVGDAFKAGIAGDADKFKKALEELSPSAQKFVRGLFAVNGALRDIGEAIQEQFFTRLLGQLKNVQGILPAVRTNLLSVAGALGDLVAEVLRVGTTRATFDRFQNTIGNTVRAILRLKPAIEPLIDAFARLAEFGSQFFPLLADAVAVLADRFREWVVTGIETGRFVDQIARTVETLRGLFEAIADIGRDVAVVFRAIGDAAKNAGIGGGGFLTGLSLITSTLADLARSAEGVEFLETLFISLRSVVDALQPALRAALKALVPIATIIRDLVVAAGPGLTDGLLALAAGLRALIPAAGPVGELLGRLLSLIGTLAKGALTALSPLINLLAAGLNNTLRILNPLFETFAGIAQEVGNAITQFLASPQTLAALEEGARLAEELGTAFADAFRQIGPALAELATGVLQTLLPIFTTLREAVVESGILDAIRELALAFGTLLTSNIRALLPVLTQLITTIGTNLTTIAVPALRNVFGALTQVVQTIATWMADPATSTLFVELITTIGQAMIRLAEAAGPLLVQLASLSAQIGEALIEALIQVLPLLPTLITAIVQLTIAVIPLLPKLVELAVIFLRIIVESGTLERLLGLVIVALRLMAAVLPLVIGPLTVTLNIITSMARAFDRLLDFINDAVNGLKRFLDLAARVTSFSFPSIPGFDKGGIIDRDMLARLHPNEVVVPLGDTARAIELSRQSGLLDLLSRAGAVPSGDSGGTQVVVAQGAVQVVVNGDVSDARARQIGMQVGDGLVGTLSRRDIASAVRKV